MTPSHAGTLQAGTNKVSGSAIGLSFLWTKISHAVNSLLNIVRRHDVGSSDYPGSVANLQVCNRLSGRRLGCLLILIASSYVEDPIWQRRFSTVWASLAGAAVLASAPHLLNSIRRGRAFKGFFGISEVIGRKSYELMPSGEMTPDRSNRVISSLLGSIGSITRWSLPGLGLNAGQSKSLCNTFSHFHLIRYFHSLRHTNLSCGRFGMHCRKCTPDGQPQSRRYVAVFAYHQFEP